MDVHNEPISAANMVGKLPDFPTTWLQDETPPKRIHGYINDVELLSVQLHEALKQSEFRFVIFGSHPYAGMLGGGSGCRSRRIAMAWGARGTR